MTPTPQELAIQFALEVSYNKQHCKFVRSLYRMRQLCEELAEELRYSPFSKGVPELPAIDTSTGSFGMMQAQLSTYAPELERWLRKLFVIVSASDSPTLTHFYLEPLCFMHCLSASNESSSSFSLESIAEHCEE